MSQRKQGNRTDGIGGSGEDIRSGYTTRDTESVCVVVRIETIEAAKPGEDRTCEGMKICAIPVGETSRYLYVSWYHLRR